MARALAVAMAAMLVLLGAIAAAPTTAAMHPCVKYAPDQPCAPPRDLPQALICYLVADLGDICTL